MLLVLKRVELKQLSKKLVRMINQKEVINILMRLKYFTWRQFIIIFDGMGKSWSRNFILGTSNLYLIDIIT